MGARSRSPPRQPRVSEQLRHWLYDWAWGRCSAAAVIRHAQAFVRDGHEDEAIHALARSAGSEQNAERALRRLAPSEDGPPIVDIGLGDIPLVLPPATLFRWLAVEHPREFQVHLGAAPGGVAGWWAELLGMPEGPDFFSKHPWLRGRSPADLARHVPLVLHDDAGPISKRSSAYVRSFHSVLGVGAERESRFLVCSYLKGAGLEDRTWPALLDSFADLARPVEGEAWGGILLFMSGDFEYACNDLGLPHYNGAPRMCAFCGAEASDEVPHNDFTPGAQWRGKVYSNGQFLRHLRTPRHPAVSHPWFSRHTYRLDLLHVLGNNGVTASLLGNALWKLVRVASTTVPGDTQAARMDFINEDMRAFYTARRVENRLPPLRISNLTTEGGFPELHGPIVKAANTRSLAPFVLELQRRAVEADATESNRHCFKALESLCAAYDLVYAAGYFLNPVEQLTLERHLTRLGVHWQRLANLHAGQMAWQMRPKLHYAVAHVAAQARLINPRFVQTYGSEGLVGKYARYINRRRMGRMRQGCKGRSLRNTALDLLCSQCAEKRRRSHRNPLPSPSLS